MGNVLLLGAIYRREGEDWEVEAGITGGSDKWGGTDGRIGKWVGKYEGIQRNGYKKKRGNKKARKDEE